MLYSTLQHDGSVVALFVIIVVIVVLVIIIVLVMPRLCVCCLNPLPRLVILGIYLGSLAFLTHLGGNAHSPSLWRTFALSLVFLLLCHSPLPLLHLHAAGRFRQLSQRGQSLLAHAGYLNPRCFALRSSGRRQALHGL